MREEDNMVCVTCIKMFSCTYHVIGFLVNVNGIYMFPILNKSKIFFSETLHRDYLMPTPILYDYTIYI